MAPYRAGSLSGMASLAGAPTFDLAIIANPGDVDLRFLAAKPPLAPAVLYGARLDGMASVAVDEAEVGRLAARLVGESAAAQSGGEALCLAAPASFWGAQAREQAFIDALAEKGLRARRAPLTEISAAAGCDAVLSLGALGGLSCVFAPADNVALGALHALRTRGADVPARAGVLAVGAGVREYAEHSFPPLTCVEIPVEQMAADCVDLLRAHSTEERRVEPKVARRASL